MEAKATRCGEQALFHMQQSQRSTATAPARQRDRQRAKGHMEERRRLQQQLDKAALMSGAIQRQIDSIVSSHMDMLIVDAMRGFNHAAANMALPERSSEVDSLAEQLADRQTEVATMQEAIMGIGASMNECSMQDDESELWRELDDLMTMQDPASKTPIETVKPRAETVVETAKPIEPEKPLETAKPTEMLISFDQEEAVYA